MIGTIGWKPASSKPAAVMPSRKALRVALEPVAQLRRLGEQVEHLRLAPTTAGGRVLLNRYGRERCRSIATISARPVKPPSAPPSALPSVPVTMSTRP